MKTTKIYNIQNRGNTPFKIQERTVIWDILPHREMFLKEYSLIDGENYTDMHVEEIEEEVPEEVSIEVTPLIPEEPSEEIQVRGFSEEDLEEKEMSELRKIGNELGVKARSKKKLIEAIMEEQ